MPFGTYLKKFEEFLFTHKPTLTLLFVAFENPLLTNPISCIFSILVYFSAADIEIVGCTCDRYTIKLEVQSVPISLMKILTFLTKLFLHRSDKSIQTSIDNFVSTCIIGSATVSNKKNYLRFLLPIVCTIWNSDTAREWLALLVYC